MGWGLDEPHKDCGGAGMKSAEARSPRGGLLSLTTTRSHLVKMRILDQWVWSGA